MDTNKLTVNPTKSKLIVVNPKLRAPQIQFSLLYDDTCIGNDKSLKYLGVELDQELNFLPHLTKIENKLSQNVGIINKLKHYLPNSALLMLYYSIVYPHILYQGCPTRGPRKSFEWSARVFQNDQSYQLNCFIIYGELAFREIGINFVDCFLLN